MQDVDAGFAEAMVILAEAYNAKISEGRIRIYAAALADLPLAAVKEAMVAAVKECAFFPTVAEIRRRLVTSTEDAALLAWGALQQAAQRVGSYQSLVLEDQRMAVALLGTFGSWPAFCAYDDGPALALKRQEFMAAYRQAVRRPRHEGRAARLPGLCELSGKYEHAGPCWAGRITAGYAVESAREPELLPPAVAQKEIGA